MGQKIKPKGLELGVSKDYKSINHSKELRKFIIFEDIFIKEILKTCLRMNNYFFSHISIKRKPPNYVLIHFNVYPAYSSISLLKIYFIFSRLLGPKLKFNISFSYSFFSNVYLFTEYIKNFYYRKKLLPLKKLRSKLY